MNIVFHEDTPQATAPSRQPGVEQYSGTASQVGRATRYRSKSIHPAVTRMMQAVFKLCDKWNGSRCYTMQSTGPSRRERRAVTPICPWPLSSEALHWVTPKTSGALIKDLPRGQTDGVTAVAVYSDRHLCDRGLSYDRKAFFLVAILGCSSRYCNTRSTRGRGEAGLSLPSA